MLLLSTWSFGLRGHDVAWPALADGGTALDAVETVCRIIDLDPEVDSVGFGGLPDRSGAMTLDGAIMVSPAECGAAAGLTRHLHPVSVARRVMERTDHVMLVGEGADRFADEQGFEPAPLLSDDARRRYEAWRSDPAPVDQSRDGGGTTARRPFDVGGGSLFDEEEPWRHHDTISALALDAGGRLAGASSTSGMPFKVPGRVGDSPIIGHGLYVDQEVGAVAATGTGELVMGVCGSFLAIELMRGGTAPLDALRAVADRLGSVERGKDADLLILDGDPLDTTARVQYVVSNGQVVVEPQ